MDRSRRSIALETGRKPLSKRDRSALWLVVLGMVAACSGTDLTVDDINDRSFGNNDELIAWVDCDGQWYRTSDGAGPSDLDWNADGVVAMARRNMGVGEHGPVADAVLAGDVWLLITDGGRLLGGFEPGHDLVWCTDA